MTPPRSEPERMDMTEAIRRGTGPLSDAEVAHLLRIVPFDGTGWRPELQRLLATLDAERSARREAEEDAENLARALRGTCCPAHPAPGEECPVCAALASHEAAVKRRKA